MHWFSIPELLPPAYRQVKAMEAVADSEDAELRQSLQWTERVLSNFFVETCDALTIAYWEALLSINPEPGQTLEERRTIVMATLNARKPITMISVREMMDNIFGAGNYVFKIDENNPLKVVIGLEGASYSQQSSFLSWFYKVCPAHLLINLTNQQTLSNSNYISAFGAPMVTARASATIEQWESIEITCYLMWYRSYYDQWAPTAGAVQMSTVISSSTYEFLACPVDETEKAKATDFGLSVDPGMNSETNIYFTYVGPYGAIVWKDNYKFEPVKFYGWYSGEYPARAGVKGGWLQWTGYEKWAALRLDGVNEYWFDEANHDSCRTWVLKVSRHAQPQPQEIDIDCNWGDAVTIPAGYTVQSVKTTRAYAKITNRNLSNSTLTIDVGGEGEYIDDIGVSDFTIKASPCLQVFVYNSNGFSNGYYITCNANQTPSTIPISVDALKLNSDGLFFRLQALYSSALLATNVYDALTSGLFTVQLRYYDAATNLADYAFKAIPNSWSFVNGTFAWTPASATYDRFWLYLNKTPATRIHCIRTEPQPTNYIEILCGLRWQNNEWASKTFSANDYWYASIMNATDKQRVLDFMNNNLGNISSGYVGEYGSPAYIPMEYEYKPVALYADENGTQLVTSDMSNFACNYYNAGQTGLYPVIIESTNAFTTPCKTWKLRITKR